MQPHVTTLICNYNYGPYIKDAVQSAIDQTYPKIGIVIVDDASTDNSWEVIKEAYFDGVYEEREEEYFTSIVTRHSSGRVILALRLRQNGGPSRARNIGISQSIDSTDYYAILDGDDAMYPEKVWKILEHMAGIPDIGAAYADYDIWDTENDTVITEYKEPFDKERLLQECIVHSGAIIKREALLDTMDQFGYYDSEMRTCEDYDLWVRISEKYVIFHIPEVLTLVRNHPQNSTRTVQNEIWQRNWQRIGLKLQARKYGK